MQIEDGFEFEDLLTGMKIKFTEGEFLNTFHVEFTGERKVSNRDFFFTHEGEFDGTGSSFDGGIGRNEEVSEAS